MRTIACGDCYRWAFGYVHDHPDAVLVHGTVAEPMGSGKRIDHAWVVHDGVVKDWQTMEAHFGGKFRGKGYPEAVYYDLWSARPEEEYTVDTLWSAASRDAKETGRMHYGPWHKNPRTRFNPDLAMLAHPWKDTQDPTGWWVSEKYDGLRAIWDGENLLSRNGNIFHAPRWFTRGLPPTALDGELWLGRGVANFQDAVSIVRSHDAGDRWRSIRYLVFDMPEDGGTFEQVQRKLARADLGPHAEVVPQERVASRADLRRRMQEAVAGGAEGLMLRKPGSRYEKRRSRSLLKMKPTYDAEAVVTGYQPGTGKHTGRMGAIHAHLLEDPTKTFKIGTGFSDAEREDPPPIGSIVEFTFTDKTRAGIPRHPAFQRIRTDLMPSRPVAMPQRRPRKGASRPAAMPRRPRRKGASKPVPVPERVAQRRDYFSMSTPQLVALGDAGAKAELKRRGRDPATGKKRR